MAATQPLNLSSLPPFFILSTHLQAEQLHQTEDALYDAGGRLSYRAPEARIFLGKIRHKKRAAFDLRAAGVWTQEEPLPASGPAPKRRKLDLNRDKSFKSQSDTDSVGDAPGPSSKRTRVQHRHEDRLPNLTDHIVVLKLEWLDACNKDNKLLPFDSYVVYTGRIIPKPAQEQPPSPINDGITYIKAIPESQSQTPSPTAARDSTSKVNSILERAIADAASSPAPQQTFPFHRRKFGQKPTSPALTHSLHPPKLHRATTSEIEGADESKLPPPPSWLSDEHPRPLYSCLRSTFPIEDNPNRYFIAQLNKIKEARLLTLDEIGVRAYSTSIASLAAYRHRISSPIEITRLPGCNEKIASLWLEWHESLSLSENPSPLPELSNNDNNPNTTSHPHDNTDDASLDPNRTIPIVLDLESSTDLHHLRLFHNIWGVGPDTARKFYLNHGWKELDDIVEFGWSTLTRVQQIGVKFYDEFQQTIPRPEVEDIARTVLHHARLCKNIPRKYWTNDVVDGNNGATAASAGDPRDFVAVIVGGYRRGKAQSGDVDVILSHRDGRLTQDLVVDVVQSLEATGFITHTLTLHTTTSDRGQQTLPYRTGGGGHGFDSLDKALCVWQAPHSNSATTTTAKNTNVHRRVDIIVSTWRTVGCAVLGWSGGTTFQRDIRRWVKRERGWKFDSSGVRDRANGLVLDLERPPPGEDTHIEGWEDRERRLMDGLGIGWRPASERCTG